nr:actin cytoskeleton-regulatory complex protein PAN1-like [Aegilops tauschii subsp. strangulata]
MPDAEVANLVNEISGFKLEESWQFGKPPYSRADPPPAIYMSPATAAVMGPGGDYAPDRAESDVDDPDLGAAALEDTAIGGVYGAGGSEEGDIETWPDDDDEEDKPWPLRGAGKVDAGPSAEPTARGGTRKRKTGAVLFGSVPKKAKNPTAATKRREAAAKAAKAPLSLKKSAAASIVGSAETSTTTRRIDPAANLREATERNAWEAREEQEAARLEKAKAERAEAAALKKLAEAEEAAAAKKQAEEAARRQSAIFVTPLSSAPPPPEFVARTGGAGGEHPIIERDGGDVAMPDATAPQPPPSEEARDKQPADPPAPPAGDEMATGPTPEVRTPTHRRLAKAASAPRPQETTAASSSIPDAEATSVAPTGWVQGGGTSPLNTAILNVQAKLQAEADALKRCNNAFLESRAAVRDYHNLRATVFNSKVQELTQWTADLSESRNFFPGHSGAANQAIKADREGRRAEGAQIAVDAPRTLGEQLLSIEARLRPAHRMLRRLQRVGAQAIAALWPDMPEDQEELVAVKDDLVKRVAAIAEYTNTSVFIPERAENGAEAPPECLDELVNFAQFHPRGVFQTSVECWPRAFDM